MSDNAEIDQNRVKTAIGVSKIDYVTPVTIAVNPTTHAVIVELSP